MSATGPCLLLFILHTYGQQIDKDCLTPTGVGSRCISILECEKLLPLVHQSSIHREELKKFHCGFNGDVSMVCCPPPTQQKCYTPMGNEGVCVNSNACPSIATLLQPPVSAANLEHAMRLRCTGVAKNKVCCEDLVPNPTTVEPNDRINVVTKNSIETEIPVLTEVVTPNPINMLGNELSRDTEFPNCNGDDIPNIDSGCCGIDSTGGNRIIGGNATAIDQYPWLGLLEYSNTRWICGGALISRRWVMTAAHCLVTSSMKSRNAQSVRLGDYDITNPGKDCVEVEGGGTDCTAEPLSIAISESIIHPEYKAVTNIMEANDIGLIRLEDLAPYTDFIRPICLPTTDVLLSPPSNMRLYVAGWGAISETRPSSPIKLHVDLPLYPQQMCVSLYSIRNKPVVWAKQLCAGGEENKDSCSGDSGGPLMYAEQEQAYQAVGITSFGVKQCGFQGRPSIYTKVFPYMDWIRSEAIP